jgi:hypothetical protein
MTASTGAGAGHRREGAHKVVQRQDVRPKRLNVNDIV